LKQKEGNIKNNNSYRLAKGLIILILLFFTEYIFAQKIFEKSIHSSAYKIVIDFAMIDQVELITWQDDDKIVVIAESETNKSPNIIIEEKGDVVFIKSIVQVNTFEQNEFDIDKQCSIQPLYPTYKIKIPKNRKIDISVLQGNFYTTNFKGDLNLKVDEGIVKINQFTGLVNVQINMGKVYMNDISDTKINVTSNMGNITSNLLIQDQSKNHLKGVFGKGKNELNIHAILANIQLKSAKN